MASPFSENRNKSKIFACSQNEAGIKIYVKKN